MSLKYKLLGAFVVMWVLGDVAQATYNEKLYGAIVMTVGLAYFENLHGILWGYCKKRFQNR